MIYLGIALVAIFAIGHFRARSKDKRRMILHVEAYKKATEDYGDVFRPGDVPPLPWRKPSRFRPVKRFFSTMRGFGLHRRRDGTEYEHWVRVYPNPGFTVAGKHWCRAKGTRGH